MWNAQNRTVYVGPPVEIGTYPFPAKLIKLEMEVGSKKAVGTRPDGTKVEVTLPEAPYLVVKSRESRDWRLGINTPQDIANNNALPKETVDFWKSHASSIVIDSKVTTPAMYIPFATVAEAFGVPEQNMEWDGGKLRVWWDNDLYNTFTPDSKTVGMGSAKDNWSRNIELEAPIRMKNGAVMIGETSGDGIYGFLFSVAGETLIKAYQCGGNDTGDLSGRPVFVCQPY